MVVSGTGEGRGREGERGREGAKKNWKQIILATKGAAETNGEGERGESGEKQEIAVGKNKAFFNTRGTGFAEIGAMVAAVLTSAPQDLKSTGVVLCEHVVVHVYRALVVGGVGEEG